MMNIGMTIFILIPLLLLFWLLYTLLFKGGKHRFQFRFGNGKGIRNVLIYTVLLIVGTVLGFLYNPGTAIKPGAEKKFSSWVLYDLVEKKADKSSFKKYASTRNTFNFSGKKLALDIPGGLETVIDRSGPTGTVEVVYYETPSIVMGTLDITKELPKPKVSLEGSELTVHMSSKELEYAGYKPSFTFAQFGDRKNNAFYKAYGIPENDEFQQGEAVLYITVPPKTDVSNTDRSTVEYFRE